MRSARAARSFSSLLKPMMLLLCSVFVHVVDVDLKVADVILKQTTSNRLVFYN